MIIIIIVQASPYEKIYAGNYKLIGVKVFSIYVYKNTYVHCYCTNIAMYKKIVLQLLEALAMHTCTV